MCIMDLLWNTNQNLMQLLSTKYSFAKVVEQYRKEKYGSNSLTLNEYLDESYSSPLIKRAIHQVIRIVVKLQSIMKTAPKRIFIEMAREDSEKGKRTIYQKKNMSVYDVKYSLNRMFDFDVVRDEEQSWVAGENGSISVVRKNMKKNNILFTRRTSEVKGGLFDQLIVPKSKDKALIKSSDSRMLTEKYGGYNKLTGTYFLFSGAYTKEKENSFNRNSYVNA